MRKPGSACTNYLYLMKGLLLMTARRSGCKNIALIPLLAFRLLLHFASAALELWAVSLWWWCWVQMSLASGVSMTQNKWILLSVLLLSGLLAGHPWWLTLGFLRCLPGHELNCSEQKERHKDLLISTRYGEASHALPESHQKPSDKEDGNTKNVYISATLPHPRQTWLINARIHSCQHKTSHKPWNPGDSQHNCL